MKQVVLIALLAGAAAGAGGAMVTTVLTMPVDTASKGSAALVDDGVKSLSKEIAELRRENGVLMDRLRALEERPVDGSSMRVAAAPTASVSELEKRVADLQAALEVAPGQVAPPAVRATVRAELQSIEEEKQRQVEQDREARRIERVDQRMTELTTSLGLDTGQARQMREVLIDESARRDQMFNAMREGGDWANGREEMQALRKDVEGRLTQFLTPEQVQKYQESDGPGWGGRFGGRGGPRDAGAGRQQGRDQQQSDRLRGLGYVTPGGN